MSQRVAAALLLFAPVVANAQATDVDCTQCVDARDIASGAVTTYKMRDQAVTAAKLAPESVTAGKLRPQSVTTSKLKNGAVSLKKLAPDAAGAIAANETSIGAIEGSLEGIESAMAEYDRLSDDYEAFQTHSAATQHNLQFPTTWMGNALFTCGQAYLYGCRTATNGAGTEFKNISYATRTNSFRFEESATGLHLWALPITVVDFTQIRFVGEANLYGSWGVGEILVDDCDTPTVALVNNARNPRPGDEGPDTIMDNQGQVYTNDYAPPVKVDVSGQTWGVLNFLHAEDTRQICTPGVSNRVGIWDQFTYTYAADTTDPKYAGPYSYQGLRTGLLDQVEQLEDRIEALEAALQ